MRYNYHEHKYTSLLHVQIQIHIFMCTFRACFLIFFLLFGFLNFDYEEHNIQDNEHNIQDNEQNIQENKHNVQEHIITLYG